MQIGIDLGATKIEYVVLKDNGEETDRARVACPKDYQKIISEINSIVKNLDKKYNTKFPVGVCHPGVHSPQNGLVKNCPNIMWLDKKPFHIECFDNSNLGGTNPVASCVVFKNGKPSKKDYRQFKIQNIYGPDDFASMEQVIYRRLKRLSEEKEPLPNLIIVDGGKGQLSSGLKSIKKLFPQA